MEGKARIQTGNAHLDSAAMRHVAGAGSAPEHRGTAPRPVCTGPDGPRKDLQTCADTCLDAAACPSGARAVAQTGPWRLPPRPQTAALNTPRRPIAIGDAPAPSASSAPAPLPESWRLPAPKDLAF